MLSRLLSSRVLAVLFFLFLPHSIPAQIQTNGSSAVVTVDVTVRTRSGTYATGLSRNVFEVNDEKQLRTVDVFEGIDTPASIGILIDTSGSMQGFDRKYIGRAQPIGQAVAELLRLSNSDNEYFLASFGKTTEFLTDWKGGAAIISEGTSIKVQGKSTAFYDGCFAAIEKLETSHHHRRILIAFSDGLDNISHHTLKELREFLKKSDVTFYAVAILNGTEYNAYLGAEGPGVLEELARLTGGEVLAPKNQKELSEAVNMVATKLRSQYRIGFSSEKNQPNKWHRIKVLVRLPGNAPPEFSKLTVRTRQGYYTK